MPAVTTPSPWHRLGYSWPSARIWGVDGEGEPERHRDDLWVTHVEPVEGRGERACSPARSSASHPSYMHRGFGTWENEQIALPQKPRPKSQERSQVLVTAGGGGRLYRELGSAGAC